MEEDPLPSAAAMREGRLPVRRNADGDIVINDPTVSSRHARVICDSRGFCIGDLNSSNGTRVNGAALDPFAPRAIAPGDAVQVGDLRLSVRSARS